MERLATYLVSLIIGLGAFALGAYTIISGAIKTQGLDSLFLIIICLLTAGVFLWLPAKAFRQGR